MSKEIRKLIDSFREKCEYLNENNKQEFKNDTYASFKGRKPYKERLLDFKNSIKKFHDLDDDKILKCIYFFGWEGFNEKEDAFEDLKERVEFYKKLPNPSIMYRAVGVRNKKMIDIENIGEHVTPYKWAIDKDMLLMIGSENWSDDVVPYIMELSVPLSEIDIIQTIIQNLSFPNEHEINLKNKGKGAKFVKAYRLKGF
jgi:hypothetical protein